MWPLTLQLNQPNNLTQRRLGKEQFYKIIVTGIPNAAASSYLNFYYDRLRLGTRRRRAFKSFPLPSFSEQSIDWPLSQPRLASNGHITEIAGNFPLQRLPRKEKASNEENDHYFYRLKYFILLFLLLNSCTERIHIIHLPSGGIS